MAPYVTGAELKLVLQQGDQSVTDQDAEYDNVVQEASDAIDNYCHRSFQVPDSFSDRDYKTTRNGLEIFQLDDIAESTALIVAVDSTNSGDYVEVSNYYVDHDNLTGVVNRIVFTSPVYRSSQGRRNVRVTAHFGWPAVPGPVRRATLIWATRLYGRKNSPSGIMGFDGSAMRLSMVDPDVQTLLNPYVRVDGLIG